MQFFPFFFACLKASSASFNINSGVESSSEAKCEIPMLTVILIFFVSKIYDVFKILRSLKRRIKVVWLLLNNKLKIEARANFAWYARSISKLLMIRVYLILLARLRRPPAFLVNGAITRDASGTKTFPCTYRSYMQSFIKIRGAVLEENDSKTIILCNFDKD